MKVLFLQADVEEYLAATSSIWLCTTPATVLERHGIATRVRGAQQVHIDHAIVNWADVIVLERNTYAIAELAIEVWKQRGKRVLLRFDDHYGVMPAHSPTHDAWHKLGIRGMVGYERFLQALPLFDSYSTPSQLLTNEFLRYNPNGVCIPNRPDLMNFPRPAPLRRLKRHNLVWGGSMPHRQSWVGSQAALGINDALGAFPDEFRLCLLCERSWFSELFTVPYAIYPWLPMNEYRQRLKAMAHIGLAPLHGPYDECRSWIKALVYALLGIPWIASELAPYFDCRGGILVQDYKEEWQEALESIIRPDTYTYLRQEGLEWSWMQGLDDHVDEWIDWLGGE